MGFPEDDVIFDQDSEISDTEIGDINHLGKGLLVAPCAIRSINEGIDKVSKTKSTSKWKKRKRKNTER